MSSSTVDVQAWIRAVSPMAFYTHCQSHQLNLCIVIKLARSLRLEILMELFLRLPLFSQAAALL